MTFQKYYVRYVLFFNFPFQLKKCECNQITDLQLFDDTNQDNVINILAKWHCVCGKKVRF